MFITNKNQRKTLLHEISRERERGERKRVQTEEEVS